MQTLSLALIGFGQVGRAFARVLLQSRERLARHHGLECRVVGLATRRHGLAIDRRGIDLHDLERRDPKIAFTDLHRGAAQSTTALIREAAPDVVVEITELDIETGQPAVDHIRAALEAGAHVVTANKGPIACAYRELRDLARARDRALRFEGTVMDGTPIFNLVAETLPGCEVLGFRGVVNSTTNFVLTAMEEGDDVETALARARAQGIVEADPANDLDGLDAAAKTAALVNVLMDGELRPREIPTTGIRGISSGDVRRAVSRGRRIRLVVSAERHDESVVAHVGPVELPTEDLLASLRGTSNALLLNTDLMGEIGVVEHDPGVQQTAYALLADLLAIARGG